MGLIAPCHVGSSRTRERTHVFCVGRRMFLTTGPPGKSAQLLLEASGSPKPPPSVWVLLLVFQVMLKAWSISFPGEKGGFPEAAAGWTGGEGKKKEGWGKGTWRTMSGRLGLRHMCLASPRVSGCVANVACCRRPCVARAFHITHSRAISSHSPLLSAPGSGLQSTSKYKSMRLPPSLIPLKPAEGQPL